MNDLRGSLLKVYRGTMAFDDLLAQFKTATFKVRQPTEGSWGAVWLRAEEGIDDGDVPDVLNAAKFARQITAEQHGQLMAVYRQRVTAKQ